MRYFDLIPKALWERSEHVSYECKEILKMQILIVLLVSDYRYSNYYFYDPCH